MPKILAVAAKLLVRRVNLVVTVPVVRECVVMGIVYQPDPFVVTRTMHVRADKNVVMEIVFQKIRNVAKMVRVVNVDVVSQRQKQRKQLQWIVLNKNMICVIKTLLIRGIFMVYKKSLLEKVKTKN
jgi:hypothetical protein